MYTHKKFCTHKTATCFNQATFWRWSSRQVSLLCDRPLHISTSASPSCDCHCSQWTLSRNFQMLSSIMSSIVHQVAWQTPAKPPPFQVGACRVACHHIGRQCGSQPCRIGHRLHHSVCRCLHQQPHAADLLAPGRNQRCCNLREKRLRQWGPCGRHFGPNGRRHIGRRLCHIGRRQQRICAGTCSWRCEGVEDDLSWRSRVHVDPGHAWRR